MQVTRRSMAGRLILAACWLFACAMSIALAGDNVEDVNLLKTAFIYKFTLFTHWPENVLNEKSAPIQLCIVGEDDLVETLGQLRGKPIKGHPVSIQAIKETQVPKNCHILYIAASERKNLPNLIKASSNQPVLTVSELPRFANTGGIFELYRENGRIRFIINLGAARKAGLEISPSLLNLATVIGTEPP
jgi:hypothetical protein